MSQLIYGNKKQVVFANEQEKREAFNYLLSSPNVKFTHEDNQNQGAWGPEERIHFFKEEGVPECLKRNMTAGRGSLYGRINCKELCMELLELKNLSSKNAGTIQN